MLLSAKSSMELAPSGASCTKLVCTPAPTVTAGDEASCARSGVASRSKTHAKSAGIHNRASATASLRTNLFSTVHPFEVGTSLRHTREVIQVRWTKCKVRAPSDDQTPAVTDH